MIIELKEITVRELVQGYFDDAENGVVGFAYQFNELIKLAMK